MAPAPVAPAVPAAPAFTTAPVAPQEIGEVFGQPGRKNWTPSEIVHKTSALRGVAGALIAMQDGLLVAGHLPPGLNAETIAAFLPQMHSRMTQYSKELKFGEANNLTLVVDDVALKIFKTGGVFFTVLGRPGEPLPEPHLKIVAAQLGPQNK
jgi:predicted regulator of Ras-like GTPase activity (Roadblock/LC7/MglB family)